MGAVELALATEQVCIDRIVLGVGVTDEVLLDGYDPRPNSYVLKDGMLKLFYNPNGHKPSKRFKPIPRRAKRIIYSDYRLDNGNPYYRKMRIDFMRR